MIALFNSAHQTVKYIDSFVLNLGDAVGGARDKQAVFAVRVFRVCGDQK